MLPQAAPLSERGQGPGLDAWPATRIAAAAVTRPTQISAAAADSDRGRGRGHALWSRPLVTPPRPAGPLPRTYRSPAGRAAHPPPPPIRATCGRRAAARLDLGAFPSLESRVGVSHARWEFARFRESNLGKQVGFRRAKSRRARPAGGLRGRRPGTRLEGGEQGGSGDLVATRMCDSDVRLGCADLLVAGWLKGAPRGPAAR